MGHTEKEEFTVRLYTPCLCYCFVGGIETSKIVTYWKIKILSCVSGMKTDRRIVYREIIAVCSQIHTKHINTLCGQNVELLNVKLVIHIVTTGL